MDWIAIGFLAKDDHVKDVHLILWVSEWKLKPGLSREKN